MLVLASLGRLLGAALVPLVLYVLFQRLRAPEKRVPRVGVLLALAVGIGAMVLQHRLWPTLSTAEALGKESFVATCRSLCTAEDARCEPECDCLLEQLAARDLAPSEWQRVMGLAPLDRERFMIELLVGLPRAACASAEPAP